MPTHYDILGVRSDAPYDEIKRSYKDLILKSHPDKVENNDNGTVTFQEVNEAWKILKDPVRRRAYDEILRHKRLEEPSMLYGTFSLDELEYDPETRMYYCVCKCGGSYSFSREGSEGFDSFLIACEQCSLMISVEVN